MNMSKRVMLMVLVTAVFGWPASGSALAAEGVPEPLVTAQWLHEHLHDVTVVTVADSDQLGLFTSEPKVGRDHVVDQVGGHVPSSLLVDFGSIRQTRNEDGKTLQALLPSAEYFTAAMDKAGLNAGRPIVVVPLGSGVTAMDMGTRLYFQLRYFGEPAGQVAVLNGGVAAWLQAGFAVSTNAAPTARGNWKSTAINSDLLVTINQVKEALKAGDEQFIDARPTPQYLGLEKAGIDRTAGHLPGAKSFPTDAIVANEGGVTTFLSQRDYRWMFANYGISPTAPTITYCNTGHLASGAWFVAHEILGNKDARLYANSLNEWTNLGNPTVGLPGAVH